MSGGFLTDERLEAIANHKFEKYGNNDKLVGLDAALIWQFVRFNPDYIKQYNSLKKSHSVPEEDDEFNEGMRQSFAQDWHMSKPLDYGQADIPADFYFEYKLVRELTDFKNDRRLLDWNRDVLEPQKVLAINLRGDRRQIIKEIEQLISDNSAEFDEYRLKPNNIAHLAESFLCYYLRSVRGLTNSEIMTAYGRIMKSASAIVHNQVDEKVQSFLDVSSKAPTCFFVGYRKK